MSASGSQSTRGASSTTASETPCSNGNSKPAVNGHSHGHSDTPAATNGVNGHHNGTNGHVAPPPPSNPHASALPVPEAKEGGAHTPFWRKTLHELDDLRSTPTLPETADVVIIGAGYAGVATAYHLLEAGFAGSIALVEARGACSGATGRNGGHMRPDLYGHIPTYIERHGLEAATALARFEIEHVQAIKEVVEREGIDDCEFTLTRTTDVWCDPAAAAKARATYDLMVGHGLAYMRDVHFVQGQAAAEGVSGVKGALACATYTAGTMFPYRFILHLLGVVHRRGINVQTHTPVTSVEACTASNDDEAAGKFKWTVHTARGAIRAGKVVHATNAYAKALLPEYAANIVPCKGICCHISVPAGRKAPRLQNSYIVREPGDPSVLSYLIPRRDGGIVVGGAGARFWPRRAQWYDNVDDGVLIEAAKDYYGDGWMQRNFHGWEDSGAEVTDIWTGVMGYSWDSNPHVGCVPGADKEGQMILAGFNGHGMPVIWLAARGVAEMVVRGCDFEETGLPVLLKTTKERLERAREGPEGGDILA